MPFKYNFTIRAQFEISIDSASIPEEMDPLSLIKSQAEEIILNKIEEGGFQSDELTVTCDSITKEP